MTTMVRTRNNGLKLQTGCALRKFTNNKTITMLEKRGMEFLSF